MARVRVAVGSNIEPRLWYVRAAILSMHAILSNLRASSIYETEPEIVVDQPSFLNAVVSGDTTIGPYRLLDELQALERRLGRRRESERAKGPRTIDLDLLLYGSRVEEGSRLTLPHPGMAGRQFVLVPLIEIDAEVRDPKTGRYYCELLAELRAQSPRVYRAPRKLYTAVKP